MDAAASVPTDSRARSKPVAWILVIGAVVLSAGAIAVADQHPSDAPQTAAETFLPPDGDARTVTYNDGSQWVIESALSTGILFMLQQPPISGNHQLEVLTNAGKDVNQTRYWRETWSDVAGERPQITEVYELGADGIRQLTLTGAPNSFSYEPGVLVLPSDVRPGSSWTSAGAALPGDILRYESTNTARARDDGCLLVDSTMSYTDPDANNQELLYSTETTTWCPGLGRTNSEFETAGEPGSATLEPLAGGSITASTEARQLDLSGYVDWSVTELKLSLNDPVFGTSELLTTTDGTSATTPSGVLVFNTGVDVAAYRLTDGGAERAWLARPGGSILWLTTIGEAVLVGTTDRKVVAYDSNGVRAWSLVLSDVLGAPPAADGSGGVLLQSLDDDVQRVSLADGSIQWRTYLGDESTVTPVVSGTSVIVADRGGTVHSLDLATGNEVWTASANRPELVAASPTAVFVASSDGALYALEPETGLPRWTQLFPGLPRVLACADGSVVLQTDQGTYAYADDGYRTWVTDATDGMLSDGTLIATMGHGTAVVADAAGTELARWQVEPVSLAFGRRLIAGPTGIWVVGSDFRVQAVSAP